MCLADYQKKFDILLINPLLIETKLGESLIKAPNLISEI